MDLVYPKERLILEADGRGHLFRLAIWQTDIAKRNRLMALGYRPLVITWADLRDRPWFVAEQVRDALRAA